MLVNYMAKRFEIEIQSISKATVEEFKELSSGKEKAKLTIARFTQQVLNVALKETKPKFH